MKKLMIIVIALSMIGMFSALSWAGQAPALKRDRLLNTAAPQQAAPQEVSAQQMPAKQMPTKQVSPSVEAAAEKMSPSALKTNIQRLPSYIKYFEGSVMVSVDAFGNRIETTWKTTSDSFYEKIVSPADATPSLMPENCEIMLELMTLGREIFQGNKIEWKAYNCVPGQAAELWSVYYIDSEDIRLAFSAMYSMSYDRLIAYRDAWVTAVTNGDVCREGLGIYFSVNDQIIELTDSGIIIMRPVGSGTPIVSIYSNSPLYPTISWDFASIPLCVR